MNLLLTRGKPVVKLMGLMFALVVLISMALFVSNISAQSGSALIVNAVASPLTAGAGNSNIVGLYITVQSSSGLIDSLGNGNFDIFAMQLPQSACRVGWDFFSNPRPGSYRIDVSPAVSGCTWERGEYIFTVVVQAGSQSGADVASVSF